MCKKPSAASISPPPAAPVSSTASGALDNGGSCVQPLALVTTPLTPAQLTWAPFTSTDTDTSTGGASTSDAATSTSVSPVVSTIFYGTHSVLSLIAQFSGALLKYRISSISESNPSATLVQQSDGSMCATLVTGTSNTGFVEIPTLCANSVYNIYLSSCNDDGVTCGAETLAAGSPYLQDANREPGVQSNLLASSATTAQADALALEAYDEIIAYYNANHAIPNPTPTEAQLLTMATNVKNMGPNLYIASTAANFQTTLGTVSANLQLAGSAPTRASSATSGTTDSNGCLKDALPPPVTNIRATTTTSSVAQSSTTTTAGTTSSMLEEETTTAETTTAGSGGGGGYSASQKAQQGLGITFLLVGTLGVVAIVAASKSPNTRRTTGEGFFKNVSSTVRAGAVKVGNKLGIEQGKSPFHKNNEAKRNIKGIVAVVGVAALVLVGAILTGTGFSLAGEDASVPLLNKLDTLVTQTSEINDSLSAQLSSLPAPSATLGTAK